MIFKGGTYALGLLSSKPLGRAKWQRGQIFTLASRTLEPCELGLEVGGASKRLPEQGKRILLKQDASEIGLIPAGPQASDFDAARGGLFLLEQAERQMA